MPVSHIRQKPKQVEPKVVSPPQSIAVILILISRNLRFLEPIFVFLGGSLYVHGVTHLLTTNRFALQFYGENIRDMLPVGSDVHLSSQNIFDL